MSRGSYWSRGGTDGKVDLRFSYELDYDCELDKEGAIPDDAPPSSLRAYIEDYNGVEEEDDFLCLRICKFTSGRFNKDAINRLIVRYFDAGRELTDEEVDAIMFVADVRTSTERIGITLYGMEQQRKHQASKLVAALTHLWPLLEPATA